MSKNKKVPYPIKLLQWYNSPEIFYEDMFGHPPFPYQKEFLYLWKNPEAHKRVICVAAGGSGKTEMLGGAGMFAAVVLSDPRIYKYRPFLRQEAHEVLILSGSLLQARKVYGYTRNALVGSPYMNDIVPNKRSIRQTETTMTNGGIIKALPNSLTATQGQHCYINLVDEAALVADFQLNDCYRIVGAHDGIIVWSGTPTMYESKFVYVFEEEQKKQRKGEPMDWELFTWSARDCPNLLKAYEEAKNTLPADMLAIFWEGIPYPLVGTLIPRDAMIQAVRGITKFEYNPTWHTVFGVDWGWGDPTALVILQTNGEQYIVLEAHMWRQTDFDYIHDFIETKAKSYSPRRIFVDASDKGENIRLMKRALPVFEVNFGKEKVMMQSRLKDQFVKNKVKLPDEEYDSFQDLIYQLRTYTWEKKSGEDLVDAMMLALKEFLPREGDDFYISSGRPNRRRAFMRKKRSILL